MPSIPSVRTGKQLIYWEPHPEGTTSPVWSFRISGAGAQAGAKVNIESIELATASYEP